MITYCWHTHTKTCSWWKLPVEILSFLVNLTFSVAITLLNLDDLQLTPCYSFWSMQSPVTTNHPAFPSQTKYLTLMWLFRKRCIVCSMFPESLSRERHISAFKILQWSSSLLIVFPNFQRYFTHDTFSMKPLLFLLIEKLTQLYFEPQYHSSYPVRYYNYSDNYHILTRQG